MLTVPGKNFKLEKANSLKIQYRKCMNRLTFFVKNLKTFRWKIRLKKDLEMVSNDDLSKDYIEEEEVDNEVSFWKPVMFYFLKVFRHKKYIL